MGIYSEYASKLFNRGYVSVPCDGKRPIATNWQTWPEEHEKKKKRVSEFIKQYPDNNIGIPLGPTNGLVALDIDIENKDLLNEFLKNVPKSTLYKMGKKGVTLFYSYSGQKSQKSVRLENSKKETIGIELLSTGNQTIMPPSIHPDIKRPYLWGSSKKLEDINFHELDLVDFSNKDFKKLCETFVLLSKDFSYELPKKTKKKYKPMSESSVGGSSGGRNDHMKSVAHAMFHRGRNIEEVVEELLVVDSQINNGKELFRDSSEFPASLDNASERALFFVRNNYKSFIQHNPEFKDADIKVSKVKKTIYDITLAESKKSKTPLTNSDNVARILSELEEYSGHFWYDEFYKDILTDLPDGVVKPTREQDLVSLVIQFQRYFYMPRITAAQLETGLKFVASRNVRNEPKDWLTSLSWDGVPRVENFFFKYLGSEDSDYAKAVSKNFFISMVARIFDPGCKVDNMVILEGDQGIKKSTALEALAGKYFATTKTHPDSKDFYLILQGRMIVEIQELDSFDKSGINSVKAAVSTAIDVFRAPFDRKAQAHPRTSIFVGTTNETEYLKDPTGNRRFWPVDVTEINIESIKRDREQLFAEAVSLYKNGLTWWDVPASAKQIQLSRTETDPWEEKVKSYLIGKDEVSVTEIAISLLDFDLKDLHKGIKNRIGNILRSAGFCNKSERSKDSKVVKKWKRKC